MKRTLSVLLCCALLTTVFAGCGEKKPTTESKPAEGSKTSEASKAAESKPEEVTGATLTFPYTGEEIHYTGYGPEAKNYSEDSIFAKEWRKHIGNIFIDWQFAPSSDYDAKVQVYLGSGNMPDVLPIYDFKVAINEYADSGMFLDFNQYADAMPNLQEYRKQYPHLDNIVNAQDQRLAIMGLVPVDYAAESWQYNNTVLQAAGVTAPPDTVEELLAAMRAVKKSQPDVIPFQTFWGLGYTKQWFGQALNAQYLYSTVYFDPAAKAWKAVYREPEARRKELIEMLATCYKEGLINPEIATMSGEQQDAVLQSGKWAFTGVYNSSILSYFQANDPKELPFELKYMAPPKAPADGKRHLFLAYLHDSIPAWGLVASSKAEKPDFLARYMDEVVSSYACTLYNYGIEGETYDMVNGEPVIKEGIKLEDIGRFSLYETYTVGMYPKSFVSSTESSWYQDIQKKNTELFSSGEMEPTYLKGICVMPPEDAAEKASIENDLNTYIDEQEAKFIYGVRPMSEWDTYVQELEKVADIDKLLELYNKSNTIDISGPRIWTAK